MLQMEDVEPLFPPPLVSSLDTYVTALPTSVATYVQTKYTVVNRDTGELYDVREIDTSMPYRYSILPHNMRVPSKARQLLGINEQPTHVPPKAAKVNCALRVTASNDLVFIIKDLGLKYT